MRKKNEQITREIETIYSQKYRDEVARLLGHFEDQLREVSSPDLVEAVDLFARGKLEQITTQIDWKDQREKIHDTERAEGALLDVLGSRLSEIGSPVSGGPTTSQN